MSNGFVKLRRTNETQELLKDPFAFGLLTVIAIRARRTDGLNVADLLARQALIGDCKGLGLTRQQYRNAKRRLKRWRLAEFTPTNRGTIATLLDDRIFDINESSEQSPANHQATAEEPSGNHRPTTNKNQKNQKKEKKYPCNSDELRLSELLLSLIVESKPDFRRPDVQRWAVQIDRMIRLDGRTPERIEAVIRWCRRDSFWRRTILSTAELRKHFDHLELAMGPDAPGESIHERFARLQREGRL
mgnify:CR=1 FL=1